MDFMKFNTMITPKILSWMYAIVAIGCVIMAFIEFGEKNNPILMVVWLAAILAVRVPFEFVMVIFKINENLTRISNEKKAYERKENDTPDADF